MKVRTYTKRSRLNYDEFTVKIHGEISKDAMMNYYTVLIGFLIDKFGEDLVRIAIEDLINENDD
jgi:hypothetical protein